MGRGLAIHNNCIIAVHAKLMQCILNFCTLKTKYQFTSILLSYCISLCSLCVGAWNQIGTLLTKQEDRELTDKTGGTPLCSAI